jgi:hypothetical protein
VVTLHIYKTIPMLMQLLSSISKCATSVASQHNQSVNYVTKPCTTFQRRTLINAPLLERHAEHCIIVMPSVDWPKATQSKIKHSLGKEEQEDLKSPTNMAKQGHATYICVPRLNDKLGPVWTHIKEAPQQ